VARELRVVVSGTGKMGRQVAQALAADAGFCHAAYVDALQPSAELDGVPVFHDAHECVEQSRPDLVIDFTNANWTPQLVEAALPRGVRLVIGTTGLGAEFVARLGDACAEKRVGAVVASNFALSAVLMMEFARQAARFFDAVEIIELHHDQKVDAPSGTAKTTAEMMLAARGRPFNHPETEKFTVEGARGGELGGIAIHSVRLPGLVAHQEVIFGAVGQALTIRQDSTGRDSYMPGVLLAARRVMELDHLVLGLDQLLELNGSAR
jgi:4-hydroxy-tetrahydrodipicolinate reductase